MSEAKPSETAVPNHRAPYPNEGEQQTGFETMDERGEAERNRRAESPRSV